MSAPLPVFGARTAFLEALALGPVVLSSPTGSGKSTEVPRWCPGRVLVIEPRRIACRSLALRVAELEGTRLGEGCGYVVRDERRIGETTRIVFATPGIALRDRGLLSSAGTIILDEFHERSLEVDLLLALLLAEKRERLVVMSATLAGERVARHVAGRHVRAEGRTYPVDVRHVEGPELLPSPTDLPYRVRAALDAAQRDAGDVLVFLPGKAEIGACMQALDGAPVSVVPLHGGLSLDEQRRAFDATPRRKVILATNVAETSLTVPGVGVVIDTGLVRQTRYHDGRGFLTLGPIAADSADQRAGRAGRTGPGVAYRLWSAKARLDEVTLPEIHRESLVPLVMGALAWGRAVEELPLLDPPKPYALEAARADLRAWDAIAGERALSEEGRTMFSLPVAPAHARLLVAARGEGCLEDAIDLVAALSTGRPMFVDAPGGPGDLRASKCDAAALVAAVRAERPSDHGIATLTLTEARQARARLRKSEGLPDAPPRPAPIAREAILRAAIAADPRLVHVARGRGAFKAEGGPELQLARESAASGLADLEAIVVLETRAFGSGREQRVLATAAMPAPLSLLARRGLGTDRLGAVTIAGGEVLATIERVLGGRVLATREEVPKGALAEEAFVTLLERGSLFRADVAAARRALARRRLAADLLRVGHPELTSRPPMTPPPSLKDWLAGRITALGVESGADLSLLSPRDFEVEPLPYELRELLDRELPDEVDVGDASYRAEYDLDRREVVLEMVKGSRKEPPPSSYLPKLGGLKVSVRSARGLTVVRGR